MSWMTIQSRLFCISDRLCDKNKFEFSTSQAKEKSSLEIEFVKKLTDERQRAIEDINTKILNNEKSLIQITPRMWTLQPCHI